MRPSVTFAQSTPYGTTRPAPEHSEHEHPACLFSAAGAVTTEAENKALPPRNTSSQRTRQRVLFYSAMLLAVVVAIDAGYMVGKARLAQLLIERSWQKSGQSGESAAKPWPWADTRPIAKITAPGADLEAWVLAGASGHSLSFGPGLADGSVAIGKPGVVMIAGHRDTSFQPLQHVNVGDPIYLENEQRQTFHYRVTDLSIADARYSSIARHTSQATLVLVTCYPFNALTAGGPLRYVVQAKLIQADVAAAPAPA